MPIVARIDLTPGANPPTITVRTAGADGQVVAAQTFPFDQQKRAVLPVTPERPAEIQRMLARMRSRSPADGDIAGVGQWLHGILFGKANWRQVNVEPGNRPIELLLQVSDDPRLHNLHNLPWEALH